ncbi:glycosyltransferase family 4 protein [Myroides odoratimimus]|uniref:glycosyltransferase family 4 protein n=1 Tax=Myroides odoratimimus TaxID=76832 RepID=UPI0029C03222|nr:glycosyltransferase family 4 protein [Myroides odoratimimus]MDX4975379.1 glycosyltransferase family 4 protein [Myroides odoratimimus]
MKKRILLIHHGQGQGGALNALLGLLEELKEDFEVDVLCLFSSQAVKMIEDRGVKVHLPKTIFYKKFYRIFLKSEASYFTFVDYFRQWRNFFMYFLSMMLFAKIELNAFKGKYDILYLNSCFLSDWCRSGSSIFNNVVIHIREPLKTKGWDIRRIIIKSNIKRYVKVVIAVSKDNLERIGLKVDFKLKYVVYDPVKFQFLENIELVKSNYNKPVRFLYLGGFQRIKGLEQLIDSLSFVKKKANFTFLGPDIKEPNSKIKKFLFYLDKSNRVLLGNKKKLKEYTNVEVIGMVENVDKYIMNSDVIISPFSKSHASLPILESFFFGKPIIASSIDGITELVESNVNGLLFSNSDIKDLAKCIDKYSEMDVSTYNSMCISARKQYEQIVMKNPIIKEILLNLEDNE